jgi:predicted HTH transcriptional regulator
MTVEKMKRGESSPRNPVLARIFRELDLIEEWGTGIPEVIQSLNAAGLPEPDFYESRERIRITVHIQNHDPLKYRVEGDQSQASAGKHQVASPEHQVGHQVTPREHQVASSEHQVESLPGARSAAILEHLRAGPSRRTDIFAAVGVHNDHRAYLRHLVPMIDGGLVAMTNPENPTAWNQRYELTETGRRALMAVERDRDA